MIDKLEAVNRMLSAINESPVSSLSSGVPDAESAARVLDEVTKDVLAKGWHCNTDTDYAFTPTVDGTIPVPAGIYRIDTTGYSASMDITVRRNGTQLCLYDVKKKSFNFTAPVYCTVVWHLDFDDLSHELQMYITYKAARRFQKSSVQSTSLDKMIQDLEAEAWAALQDSEGDSEDYNVLTDSLYMLTVTSRNSRVSGI